MTTRRQVLRGAGGVITIALGGLQIACTRDESAQIDAAGIDDLELVTLVAVMQRLLPHDQLDPAVYRDAVQAFLKTAEDEPTVVEGLANLREQGFADLSTENQIVTLSAIEETHFFRIVRDAAVRSLYSDQRTWTLLGYEGDASRFGGYIDRGFNDIDWLPDVEMGS